MTALAVRSKVRDTCSGMRCSGDFFNALDKKIENVLKIARERAKANGRATIRPCDL